jgi:uncharacterized protein
MDEVLQGAASLAGLGPGGSVIFLFRARRGREDALARWTQRIVGAARMHPGSLDATVIGPDGSGTYRVVHHFLDQAALESWLASPQRAELLREAEALLDRPPAVERTGLETWFRLPSDTRAIVPPSRWKMWLTSVLAIYPLVFAFLAWVNPHIKEWPIALRAAVFPLVLLSLMTYLVMPTITRLLRPWLSSRPE